MNSVKNHWDNIFQTKDTTSVSWFEDEPAKSIELVERFLDNHKAPVIEVGGGDSKLPDFLLKLGYSNVTVLDISEIGLQASKKRLAGNAERINWITTNVLDLHLDKKFRLWHDRAVFHFLQSKDEQKKYKEVLLSHLDDEGIAIVAGFSKNSGPEKCSNLQVSQIDKQSITNLFYPELEVVESFEEEHNTPGGSTQNFSWNILKHKK